MNRQTRKPSPSNTTCPQALCSTSPNVTRCWRWVPSSAALLRVCPSPWRTCSLFTETVTKGFAVFENVFEMLFDKCSEFCTIKLKTSDDVFNFLKDQQERFPDQYWHLLLDLMRRAGTCHSCLQPASKRKDREMITWFGGAGSSSSRLGAWSWPRGRAKVQSVFFLAQRNLSTLCQGL